MYHLTPLLLALLTGSVLGEPFELTTGAALALPRPSNTDEAIAQGWVKTDETCDPSHGEAWLYEGELSFNQSVTMYFTPAVGSEAPGVVSAVMAHYYDHIPEDQVGTFFSFEKFDAEGSPYNSVAVVMYDTAKQSLCDDTTALPATTSEYFAVTSVNPEVPNRSIPLREDAAELEETWVEGSCINRMGYHWLTEVGPESKEISYDHNSMLPVVPMYHPVNKGLVGWFFWGAGKKNVWDTECPDPLPYNMANSTLLALIVDCMSKINVWDPGPNLQEVNEPPFFMCSNTCDSKCSFQGSTDGGYTTMHWFVQYPLEIDCPGPAPIYCRNNLTLDQFDKQEPGLSETSPEETSLEEASLEEPEIVSEEPETPPEDTPLEESDSEDW